MMIETKIEKRALINLQVVMIGIRTPTLTISYNMSFPKKKLTIFFFLLY